MYVLACPCVRDTTLRAEGITDTGLRKACKKALRRCKEFGIDVVFLPCPETEYLGRGRKPAHFLEIYNTPEFVGIIDRLSGSVNEIIHKRGPPLCLLGVDSSPTCGVTTTYYGSLEGENPKKSGRGVLFSRFPDIPAIDLRVFARYTIYLSAPLFSHAEQEYNRSLARFLKNHFFRVYLPQEEDDTESARDMREQHALFSKNLQALKRSDIVVAVIDGADADSGTAWEMGYAYAQGKPVIAIRSDFRMAGMYEKVNLMLEQGASVVSKPEELLVHFGIADLMNNS
ncbi:MAG: nucleoside 2-deoxyribosyltransferase [Methanospirillaceae archaeon]|nr:nucleoside 2-deoxyribosyltransferase [Methanospirillaceae archaeon]